MTAIHELGISGEVIRPDDSGYEEASTTYAARGAPAMIVRPRDAAGVAAAIRYAADNDLLLSVRSGGHSALGFGTNTGGVVIDVSSMNSVQVLDPATGLVRIGAGATWGEVSAVLQRHVLALTSGDTVSVGVGGLTLGGGVGHMARKYGLTIDSLRAAEVVTADGRIRQVSADQHADLFWAIRGGGGNFGVVTHFDFVAATVPSVYAGTIQYHLDDLPALLENWRDCLRSAPDELTSTFLLMPPFGDLPPAAGVFVCYAGSDGTSAMRAVEPLLDHGSLAGHDLAVRAYAEILEEAHLPEGVRVVVKNALVDSLGDDVIDAIDTAYAGGRGGAMFVRSLGGAMTRVPRDATAFAHRDAEAMVVAAAFLAPDASDADIETALQPWRTIAGFGSGAYANFLGTATDSDIADIYPPATYERLARVKRAYDPTNLFSRNHNISPAG